MESHVQPLSNEHSGCQVEQTKTEDLAQNSTRLLILWSYS